MHQRIAYLEAIQGKRVFRSSQLRYNLPMFDDLHSILEENCQLTRSQPIIIGVSGGADSLTLLDILVKWGYPVVAAHFNHLLRPGAGDEARTVEGIAETIRIPYTLGVGSAADYAREHHLSIEEAAREVRYRFLFEQAEKHNVQAVVVAHNADDQVETVLLHLLRGSGLDGLTGMPCRSLPNPWSESIPLVRPLLSIWRSEIETYCTENGLNPAIDQSNAATTYFRTRLRPDLMPALDTYVPGFRTRLFQTGDLLAADRAVLDDITNQAWQEVVEQIGDDYATFILPAFRLQPLGIQRRLIRKAISQLRPGARDLGFSMVQRVINFAAKPNSTGQTDIGLGLRAFLEGDNLFIAAWEADLPTTHWPQITDRCPLITDHASLPIPGELDLGSGWILKAEIPSDVESAKIEAQGNRDPNRAWIDLGGRQPLLNIRPRLPGDRFQPLGMGGKSVKISDFMINQKIPQRARAGWPLVISGDEIVWVPGYRLAHPFRLTDQARNIVFLQVRRSLLDIRG